MASLMIKRMDMKILMDDNHLAPSNAAPTDFNAAYHARPAWISPRHPQDPPEVTAYRLHFDLPQATVIRVHVSADERYILYLDRQCVGRGPERGSDRIWFYETYDLNLVVGSHTLVALVWQLGEIGPLAQVGLAGGFLLDTDGSLAGLVSTKSPAWETKPVDGISFKRPAFPRIGTAWFVEPIQTIDGAAYPWGVEMGAGEGWEPAITRREDYHFPFGIQAVHVLQPAMLPAQMASPWRGGRVRYVSDRAWNDPQEVVIDPNTNLHGEAAIWQALLDGSEPIMIPSHTHRQVVLDLEQYVCAYPQIRLSGGKGSRLIVGWAEALYLDSQGQAKGQRDEVEGGTFIALCHDDFLPDGGAQRQFEPLWWRAGRFIEVLVETGDQPLTVEGFSLLETRYPLEMESRFSSSDPRLEAVMPIALRGLQMCAHETYMDCPYYEQMMYVGDSRLEALTTYAISADDRLPRKAIMMFGLSRLPDGLTQARYPSRDVQVIPPFALWWIGMVYDYALWRGDHAFVAGMLPGVRAVLDSFLAHIHSDNLLHSPNGWNFADWIADWPLGVPPDGFDGFSGLLNWHLVYTLGLAAHLEEWAGESLSAQRWYGWRNAVATASRAAFWDEQRGLFADDQAHTRFSEHTQCLALLSGELADEQYTRTAQNLLRDASLTRTTIYFTHYLFETYRLLEQPDAFFRRMSLWFNLPAQGFKTTPEQPEPTRSDCHGWGAHPLYHYFTSLMGIRPTSFGFEHLEITPMPGTLTSLSGKMVHPRGWIEADLYFNNGRVRGKVSLPAGLIGTFHFAGKKLVLKPVMQLIEL
jgi:alpha-L-rhamnosidase